MSLKRNESTDHRWTSPGEPIMIDPFGDPSVVFKLFRPLSLKVLEGGDSTPVNDNCDFMNRSPGQSLDLDVLATYCQYDKVTN